MARHDVVAQKLTLARTRLQAADEVFARPREQFLEQTRERDLATFYLFLAIQECINIAVHWVADADWGLPEEAGGAFEVLAEKGVIGRDLVQALRGATGLRNRIAHGYGDVDPERMYTEYRKGTEALREFLAQVADRLAL